MQTNSFLLLIMLFRWFRTASKNNQDGHRTWSRGKSWCHMSFRMMFASFVEIYIYVDANDIVVIFSAFKSFFNANRLSNEFLRRYLLVSSRTPLSSHDQVYLSQDALFTHSFLCRKPEEQADLSVSEGKLPKETTELRVWYQPIETIHYALLESIHLINHYFRTLISHRKTFVFFVLLFLFSLLIYKTDGSHQENIRTIESLLYWIGLGVASSIGLGTGLHTFLLYLGPFIAQVTLAAYECGSTEFPHPPYPNDIVCPSFLISNDTTSSNPLVSGPISLWNIMWKVKLEAFCWGLGTALGELPPYFMARAARRGSRSNDDELMEFEQLIADAPVDSSRKFTMMDHLRYYVYRLIQRVGFFGILLCASIPNPLFDLAGMTCGYFLIPFWHFFFATLIGKALIKMTVQSLFIIVLFSEHHVERLIHWMKHVPSYGRSFQQPFQDWLREQKERMHRTSAEHLAKEQIPVSILSQCFSAVLLLTLLYFLLSIVNSLAQRYDKRRRRTFI